LQVEIALVKIVERRSAEAATCILELKLDAVFYLFIRQSMFKEYIQTAGPGGAATRHSTFNISMTFAPTIFIPMHKYFNDFIFQLYISTLYKCTCTVV
jgi:hypothetical protein